MQQRGRKSAASLAVVGATPIHRVAPPEGLGTEQKAVFLSVVNSMPADWFGAEHLPLLVAYCRHVVTANVVAREIEAFQPEWMATDEGLERYEKLMKMAQRESASINGLARSMRLTHQSKYRADKAHTLAGKSSGNRPWEYEAPEISAG